MPARERDCLGGKARSGPISTSFLQDDGGNPGYDERLALLRELVIVVLLVALGFLVWAAT